MLALEVGVATKLSFSELRLKQTLLLNLCFLFLRLEVPDCLSGRALFGKVFIQGGEQTL